MGNYTALYGRITLKHDVAKVLYRPGDDMPEWERLKKCRGLAPHPDVRAFINVSRRGTIGRGASAYFDWSDCQVDEWDDLLEDVIQQGWQPQPDWAGIDEHNYDSMRHYNPHTRELTFFCSLKNYGGTIEAFINILPLIADDWMLFREYERMYAACAPDRIVPTKRQPKVVATLTDLSTRESTNELNDKIYSHYNDAAVKITHLPLTIISAKYGEPIGTAIEHGKPYPDEPFGYGY